MEAAIYEQSFRALDEQARVLDGLRARAGTLVSLATVTTAFVGGLAATSQRAPSPKLSVVAWVAIALYLSVVVLSLLISSPGRSWVFAHHPHRLLSVYLENDRPESLSAFRRTIAYYNGSNYESNGRQLGLLSTLFAAASVLFMTELVLWLWVLAA